MFKEAVTSMGHKITKHGIVPDPLKTKAIAEMPWPKDILGVKRLCGMIQYLAIFLPNLSNDLALVRALTKKEMYLLYGMRGVRLLLKQ